uniref:hypothetical protein n=1 Tax=Sodalis glossinidius TaxID=63612 RepID=UPI000054C97C|nr:hypothetical protein [Sodalis glossinidius]CAI59328.1 hypothetical protein pSG1.59 [Sodalis glossinidius]CAI59501.1 hypothetical protein pSG1.59 [Sodalis glossinidius]
MEKCEDKKRTKKRIKISHTNKSPQENQKRNKIYTFLTPIIIYAFLFIVTMMDKRKDKIEISIIRDNEEVAIKKHFKK